MVVVLHAFRSRAHFPDLDLCPLGHPIFDLTVRCSRCGRFVMFLPSVYQGRGRARSLFCGMTIVLTAVISFVVFRYTDQVWPLYWFLVLGIVHLYATVFTRGAALGSAAAFLVLTSAGSLAWTAIDGSEPAGVLGRLADPGLRILPVLGWLLTTLYLFMLGRQALLGIRTASRYFLAAATLTLGYWGVWLFYLENDLVNPMVYQAAIGAGLLVPVVSVLFLFNRSDRDKPSVDPVADERERRLWRVTLGALALVVVAVDLVLVEPLSTALAYVLGQFLPRLVGVVPLADIDSRWLSDLGWRRAATSALLLVAVALIVVRAALDTAYSKAELRDDLTEDMKAELTTMDLASRMAVGSRSSTARGGIPTVDPRTLLGGGTTERAIEETSYVGRYLGETAYRIVRNIFDTLRRSLHAVLPLVAFTLLGLLIVLVVAKLGEYLRHGPFLDAVSLWGMTMTIIVGVVVLCGIAFDFVPSRERPWRRLRILGVPLVVIAAGALLAAVGYFLVSVASWALLPMVWPADARPAAMLSRHPYVVNLAISTVALGILAVLYAIGRVFRGNSRGASRLPGLVFSVPAAVVLLAVAGASVSLAAGPIGSTVAFATGRYSPEAAQILRQRLPAALAARCEPDHLLMPGQLASLDCRGEATDVSFHAFGNADDLHRAYRAALSARGVAMGTGSCEQQWPGENPYPGPGGGGRVACYVDERGAWLLWVGDGVLGIAIRDDGRPEALFSSWSGGAFRLRSA
jgi:hypothetical protein